MLVLTRKPSQAIQIDLTQDLDPQTPVGALFAAGPIEIVVGGIRGGQVKLGIKADPRFRILRDGLGPKPAALPRAASR